MKSILGNFGFQNQNAKEIEQELEEKNEYDSSKQSFTFSETIEIIARKWFLLINFKKLIKFWKVLGKWERR